MEITRIFSRSSQIFFITKSVFETRSTTSGFRIARLYYSRATKWGRDYECHANSSITVLAVTVPGPLKSTEGQRSAVGVGSVRGLLNCGQKSAPGALVRMAVEVSTTLRCVSEVGRKKATVMIIGQNDGFPVHGGVHGPIGGGPVCNVRLLWSCIAVSSAKRMGLIVLPFVCEVAGPFPLLRESRANNTGQVEISTAGPAIASGIGPTRLAQRGEEGTHCTIGTVSGRSIGSSSGPKGRPVFGHTIPESPVNGSVSSRSFLLGHTPATRLPTRFIITTTRHLTVKSGQRLTAASAVDSRYRIAAITRGSERHQTDITRFFRAETTGHFVTTRELRVLVAVVTVPPKRGRMFGGRIAAKKSSTKMRRINSFLP